MTRAEERALEAYPGRLSGSIFGPLPVDLNKACREKYQEGYEQAEKDLGWISIKDRLPKERGWYFTCINHYGTPQALGVTYYDCKEWLDDDDSTENVDYWMEVPKLPKEEENETK